MYKHSPWIENLKSPTNYRLGLARAFSHDARQLFGDRWKGVYVMGSTAAGMASHIGDVDVLPLIALPKDKDRGPDKVFVPQLKDVSNEIERKTGVFVEVWDFTAPLNCGHNWVPTYVEELVLQGVTQFFPNGALLLGNPIQGLPRSVAPSESKDRYSQKGYSSSSPSRIERAYSIEENPNIRGETKEAILARFRLERRIKAERNRLYALLEQELPKFQFEESTAGIAALIIATNFIPCRYGWYNRLEFLVSWEPRAQALIGRIPDNAMMRAVFSGLAADAICVDGFKDKLRELDALLVKHGFDESFDLFTRSINDRRQLVS